MTIRKRLTTYWPLLLAGLSILIATGCSSAIGLSLSRAEEPPAPVAFDNGLDEELAELQALLRHDLTKGAERFAQQEALLLEVRSETAITVEVDPETTPLAITASRLFSALSSLPMPVVGLLAHEIEDSYGQPRDRGRRSHQGIDLFAPRGTPVVAVADGYLSYIGQQRKGGKCIWLVSDNGFSFYYAHLDRWEPGITEGMHVQNGALLGYVGSTGNAAGKSPHLHFSVVREDKALNPYPLLVGSAFDRPEPVLTGGFAGGQDK